MLRTCRIGVSGEADLTSHLSISYSAAPTASGIAAAGGPAVPGAAAGAHAGGMAGFLAALVDQLLAGAAATAGPAAAAGADAAATDATTAAPFGAAVDPAALAAVQSAPRGNMLLRQLTQGLKQLQDQLDTGKAPDPDLLKRLGEIADSLAAMISVPVPQAVPSPGPDAPPDPLAAISRSSISRKTDPLGVPAEIGTPPVKPGVLPDQAAQLLASLGPATAGPAAPDATPAVTSPEETVPAATPARPLPAIAQLGDTLAQLGQAIAATSPEVAQKLDVLAKKLVAAETAPSALASLTSASDSQGKALDDVVQTLLAAKSAAPAAAPTPSLAARTELPMPAPMIRTAPQTDTPQPPPAPANTSALAMTQPAGPKSIDGPAPDGASKPEARIIAAAAAANDGRPADDTRAPSQATAATAPPVAPAPPRAIPAAYQAAASPINMGQLAFEMVRQVHQGTSRFSFRLDPPELGRVDVKLHVDATGTVNARLTVERSETLDMFQRDRGALEKALSQAGLDGGKTNLEFSLKQNQQNPFAGLSGGGQRPGGGAADRTPFSPARATGAEDPGPAVPSITLYRGVASIGGVNLFV